MMTTTLFYLDLSGKKFCQKSLKSKNCKRKLRHQVVEVEAMEAEAVETEAVEAEALEVEAVEAVGVVESEAIQKLPLPHPWLKGLSILINCLVIVVNCFF